MAAITISSPSYVNFNPTSTFLPVYNGIEFANSLLSQDDPRIIKTVSNSDTPGQDAAQGLFINNSSLQYQFGDIQGENHGSLIEIDSDGNINNYSAKDFKIELFTDGDIKIGSSTILTPTAYGNSGQHMRIYVAGTLYLIQLLKSAP